jgi:tetratricopeptide (TPR) repeat protein
MVFGSMPSNHTCQPQPVIALPLTWSHLATAVLSCGLGVLVTWAVMKDGAKPSASVSAASTPSAVSSAPAPSESGPPPAEPGQSPAERAVVLGNWYYDQHRWSEAISQYQAALAGGVDNPNVRTDLGNCFRFSGDAGKALEQYDKAQSQDRNHEQSLFNTITLYSEVLHNSAKATETAKVYLSRFQTGEHLELVRRLASASAAATPAASPAAAQQPAEQKTQLSDWMKQQGS